MAKNPSPMVGLDAKMYWKSVGWAGVSTGFTELTIVEDVKLNESKDEADASTRGNGGREATMGALMKSTIECKILYVNSDAGYIALADSFHKRKVIGIACMDGPIATGEGLIGDFEVMKFDRDESLKNAVKVDVTLRPTFSLNPPQWLIMGVVATTTPGATTTAP